MGQTFSSHAQSEDPSRRVSRLSELTSQREQSRSDVEQDQEEGEQSLLGSDLTTTIASNQSRLSSIAAFRRQISAHTSAAAQPSNTAAGGGIMARENNALQSEERSYVSMDELRIPDTPITDITASPMPRRRSIWRFGARHTHRFSSTNRPDSERPSGDIVIQQSLSDEANQEPAQSVTSPWRFRHTILNPIPGLFGLHEQPTRRRLAPISRPIPIAPDSEQYNLIGSGMREAPTPVQSPNTSDTDRSRSSLQRRTSRLSRVRRSISGPMESVFGGQRREPQDQTNHRPRLDTTSETTPDETEYLLPPINVADTSINLDEPLSNEHAPVSPYSLPQAPEGIERPRSWAQRLADRAPGSRRESRGLNLLRGRSSRLIRRDDEAPLSRILQLAAAAIAAQLSGSTDALANLESVGDDHFDGGLNNFVEELNSVTGSANDSTSDNVTTPMSATPLNFWRVFRFVSPSEEHSTGAPESDSGDPRTVTLVVVGVRSVPSSSIPREAAGDSGLDTLLAGPSGRAGHPGLLRSSLNRARLGRRSSVAGSTPFPQQYDSQRHQRTRPLSGLSTVGPTTVGAAQSATGSPRHSTISSDHINRLSSGPPSPANGFNMPDGDEEASSSVPSRQRSNRSRSPTPAREELASDPAVRQRRRSASETARHRTFGSGASRRNGTIDPDGGPVQGRSWLIYVVGTNLPEDHPAFTTPSLFTDNPSYEDMLLLSNILGPVKPPVASSDDVAASGGTFRIILRGLDGSLRAQATDGDAQITILGTESCQVCLEAYTPEQIVRKLNKCAHLFHQECVDEWLTTGRNSCPLCRGQGVNDSSNQNEGPNPDITTINS